MTASADSSAAKKPAAPIAVEVPITLGQFVKLAGLAVTGGDAKQLVAAGHVRVNGQVEKRRGHKLDIGDTVEVGGTAAEVLARANKSPSGKRQPGSPRPEVSDRSLSTRG
jgi:ribosome-associated protein